MRLFLFIIVIFCLSGCDPNENRNILWVEAVIDGDTFIADGQRYRIWGADAPEKEEPYYHTARLYMESLILDESLTCNTIDIGKYGRYVVRCYLGHQDIAAEIINAGLARDDSSFSNHYYQREEARAQKNKIGLWAP